MTEYQHLKLDREGTVARLRLNRPEVHNAFDEVLISELTRVAGEVAADDSIRIVVLSGEGKSFSAGADINWMRRMVDYTFEENQADSHRLAAMLRAIDQIPKPVVCRIHGVALGGGVGLLSVCDVVVSADDVRFSLSEVRLGILPAVISPFVLRRLSQGVGRSLFLTGERFGAERARAIGLVDQVCSADELDATVDRVIRSLKKGGPIAQRRIKELIPQVWGNTPKEMAELTTRTNAEARASEEGQDGLKAFLEKRKPSWLEAD